MVEEETSGGREEACGRGLWKGDGLLTIEVQTQMLFFRFQSRESKKKHKTCTHEVRQHETL